MHGLLSLHCYYKIRLNPGDNVIFIKSCPVYNKFSDQSSIDRYMENWEILEVISDEKCGYLGIIYKNEVTEQIVLAHRSTNSFAGINQDIEGIVNRQTTTHQCLGLEATKKAVEKIKINSVIFLYHSLDTLLVPGWLN